MDTKKRAISASVSVVVNFVTLALAQLLIAPFVIRYADAETLGEFSILLQIVGYLAILDFGFTAAFQRDLARSSGIEPPDHTAQLLKDGRSWFAGVDVVRALFGAGLIALFALISTAETSFTALQKAFWLIAGWYLLRGWLSIYSPALIALQNIPVVTYLTALSSLVRLAVSIGLLMLGLGLEAMVWGIILSEVALNLGCYLIYNRRFGPIRVLPFELGWQRQKTTVSFGLRSVPIGFASVSKQQSDGLIVGLTLGAGSASILYTTKMPVIMAMNLIYSIIITVTPALYQMHARNEQAKLVTVYRSLHRYNFMMSFVFMFGLILYHHDFTRLWVGESQYAGLDVSIVYAVFTVLVTSSNINSQFTFSQGDINRFSMMVTLEGFITLASVYLMSLHFGLFGTVLALFLSSLISAGYLWRITLRAYADSRIGFLRHAVLPPLLAAGGAAALAWLLTGYLIPAHAVVQMGVFCAIAGLAALLFILSREDKRALAGVGGALLGRLRP